MFFDNGFGVHDFHPEKKISAIAESRNAPILLALIGNPLGHSISPVLFETAGEAMNVNISYLAFELNPDELEDGITGLKTMRFKGCNVTIPLKKEVLKYTNSKSKTVETIGAANVLTFENGLIKADNTDWQGFLQSWEEENLGEIKGKDAVLLGTGGAAESVIYALAHSGIRKIALLGRNINKTQQFADSSKERYENVIFNVYSIDNKEIMQHLLSSYNILINATSVGMYPHSTQMPIELPQNINRDLVYYDLVYNPIVTKMSRSMNELGIKTCGGIRMLVNQAAIAFEKWTGVPPDRKAMLKKAYELLS